MAHTSLKRTFWEQDKMWNYKYNYNYKDKVKNSVIYRCKWYVSALPFLPSPIPTISRDYSKYWNSTDIEILLATVTCPHPTATSYKAALPILGGLKEQGELFGYSSRLLWSWQFQFCSTVLPGEGSLSFLNIKLILEIMPKYSRLRNPHLLMLIYFTAWQHGQWEKQHIFSIPEVLAECLLMQTPFCCLFWLRVQLI